jgi:hypothetical protein
MTRLSGEDKQALEALRRAVAEALERKRRLGQYAVIWRDGRAIRIGGDEKELSPSASPAR